MIEFHCNKCGRRHSVKEEFGGKRGKCPCGNLLVIPTPAAQPVSTTEKPNENLTPPQVPVIPPIHEEPLYINEKHPGGDEIMTYCEKCKRPHPGMVCPSCGEDDSRGTFGGCLYCGTSYRASRKKCPVCRVDANLMRATTAQSAKESLTYWQAAYDEARTNRYYFSLSEHRIHVGFLIEAGHGSLARHLLDRLSAYVRSRFPAVPRDLQEQVKYFSALQNIEQPMSDYYRAEAQKSQGKQDQGSPSLVMAYAVHAIMDVLLYRAELKVNTDLMPDIFGEVSSDVECLEKVNIDRMKEVLKAINKNAPGRPEALSKIINKNLSTIPIIDEGTVRQDVAALFAVW
jgi:hypothetical protein